MKIEVTLRGSVTVEPEYEGEIFDHDGEVEHAFSGTMRELVVLGVEPLLSGSLASGAIEITLTVEAESVGEAVTLAESTVRAAFLAAGVNTAGWETTMSRVHLQWSHAEADVPA